MLTITWNNRWRNLTKNKVSPFLNRLWDGQGRSSHVCMMIFQGGFQVNEGIQRRWFHAKGKKLYRVWSFDHDQNPLRL